MDRYEIFRANQLETKNFLESIRKGKIPRRVVIKNIITGSGIISISSFSKREICKSSFDVTNETLRTRYLSKLFCSVHVLRPCHKFPRNFCMENLSLAIIRVSVINVQLHEEIFKRTSAKQNPSSNEGDLLVHTKVHTKCVSPRKICSCEIPVEGNDDLLFGGKDRSWLKLV